MYKARVLTAFAVVIAGASLRPLLSSNPQTEALARQQKQAVNTVPALPLKAEGPWKASCRYWEAGRPTAAESAGAKGQNASSDCGEDGWGIPKPASTATPITAIIATVPDPVHSALPLEFDRSIDVLTHAASEYGFTGSYFWLPWRQPRPEATKESSPTLDAESEQDLDREKQPGLMIFKRSGAVPGESPKGGAEAAAKDDVLYLFLVSQSPALGMNAAQLRNAIDSERYLAQTYHACTSFKIDHSGCWRDNLPNDATPSPVKSTTQITTSANRTTEIIPAARMDIIGPNNSGAAASLLAALDAAQIPQTTITVAGITSTDTAATMLNQPNTSQFPKINFLSFGDDGSSEQDQISKRFRDKNGATGHIAFLTESGTVYGQAPISHFSDKGHDRSYKDLLGQTSDPKKRFLIQFPRNISLLRNAQKESTKSPEGQASAAVSPYMHLSLKDSTSEDGVPSFMPAVTEFSQEAQWMSIAHELRQKHISVVAISASNILDELFLINFLNRDVPDARVIVYSDADLLFTRIGDNAPYVGTVTLTAYPFTAVSSSSFSLQLHSFSDSYTEAFFNAASYIFWDGRQPTDLRLANYEPDTNSPQFLPPPLWATAAGRDGYYPLGILNQCASGNPAILPLIRGAGELAPCSGRQSASFIYREINNGRAIFPAISWYMICALITVVSIAHSIALFIAKFWTSITRDLAIRESDQPRRRTVYIHIAIAVLFSMSFIAAFPLFAAWNLIQPKWYTAITAVLTLLSGFVALIVTAYKTRGFLGKPSPRPKLEDSPCVESIKLEESQRLPTHGFYILFNILALLTVLTIPAIWVYLCTSHSFATDTAYVGLFFSYRCLYPASGVCPLLPVLLILMTWYIWAHLQTRRLRFSENNRPLMPLAIEFSHVPRLFVSDQDLSRCSRPFDCCLYENMTCLLITRQLIQRFKPARHLNVILATLYIALFCVFVVFFNIQGLDRFLHEPTWYPAPYELLVAALYYPLLLIALAGCVRMLVIWSSLNNGLLEPLERSPLRFAFSHLTNVAWTTMLRQGGFLEYRRDLARSSEAIRHLSHSVELHNAGGRSSSTAKIRSELESHIYALYGVFGMREQSPNGERHIDSAHLETRNFLVGCDLPGEAECRALNLMSAIECDYASYSKAILRDVLVPYWLHKQGTFVEAEPPEKSSSDDESKKPAAGKSDGPSRTDPVFIQLAEEFLAIRYLSLIRAVLINLRFLMSFVSTAFVLALLAWNSYPFQPRRWVDWTFTMMLFGIGAAVVWVFAQMHRNSILSRITGTKVNELGSAFFVRLVTYGSVPLLTWLASQFPVISNGISRLLQSGLTPVK